MMSVLTSSGASLCQPHLDFLSTGRMIEALSDLPPRVTLSGPWEDQARHVHHEIKHKINKTVEAPVAPFQQTLKHVFSQ